MDALPVTEETGLPYTSKVTATDAIGNDVGVMHACGHDIHMSVWTGTANLLAGISGLHSAKFTPDYGLTIRIGVKAMSRAVLDLLENPGE